MQPTQKEAADKLSQARQLIKDGRPSAALEIIVELLRKTNRGDERAVLKVLQEAKEATRQKGMLTKEEYQEILGSLEGKASTQDPILSEEGKEQIMRDAYADGSSFICKKCGALVPVKRMKQHREVWCPAVG